MRGYGNYELPDHFEFLLASGCILNIFSWWLLTASREILLEAFNNDFFLFLIFHGHFQFKLDASRQRSSFTAIKGNDDVLSENEFFQIHSILYHVENQLTLLIHEFLVPSKDRVSSWNSFLPPPLSNVWIFNDFLGLLSVLLSFLSKIKAD